MLRSLRASAGLKAEGVATNNQRSGDQDPGCVDMARHIVPTALLVRVKRIRNDLYKAVKGQAQDIRSVDDLWVIPDEIEVVSLFSSRTR